MDSYSQKILDIILSELGDDAGVFLFGSRARGDHQEFADFDIGLYLDNEVPRTSLHKIREKLTESDIPFTVDIIDFYTAKNEFRKIASEEIKIWNNPSQIHPLIKSLKS